MNPDRLCPGCQRTYTVTGGDFDPNWTVHPGEMWRECIEALGTSQRDVAAMLDISEQLLSNILNGHRLPSVELTIVFARLIGAEPRFLWQWTTNYQLDIALGKIEA